MSFFFSFAYNIMVISMRQFLPNMHPLTFTTSAVIIGYLLIDELTIAEQAALGAWFNVVGDVLASASSWSSVIEERREEIKENNDDSNKEIELLKKSIAKIQKILEDNNINNNEVKDNEKT